MGKPARELRGLCLELALVCLLAVLAAGAAGLFLKQYDGRVGLQDSMETAFFIPPVLFATGHGFANAGVVVPELEYFLNQAAWQLSAAQLPPDLPLTGLNPIQQMHPYLVYLLGGCWRVFGISWTVVQALLIALFCMVVLLVYALFRLGMNRLLSVIAALLFLLAPTTFVILPALRDFSKAPFILAVMLLLGVLIKHAVPRRTFWGLSVLLGLVVGIGLGFRFDASICVVPVLVVLGFCPRPAAEHAIRDRLLAVALFCAALGLSAWPVLTAYRDTGTPAHDIMMGFDAACEDHLGLSRASYERLTSKQDTLAVANTRGHAERVQGYTGVVANRTSTYNRLGFGYILHVLRTFPGDMLTRGYAATVWALGYTGADEPQSPDPFINALYRYRRPFAVQVQRFGPYAAALTLLLISARSLRRAWLVFFLVLYFGSYVNLLFEARHHFHMAFVPFWFAGFLADQGLRAIRAAPGAATGGEFRRGLLSPRRWMSPAAKRALGFGFSAVLLLVIPLVLARVWQDRTVTALAAKCEAASVEELEVETRVVGDWVLFQPRAPLSAASYSFYQPPMDPFQWDWPFPAYYLVAEIAASPEKRATWLRYEAEYNINDFSFVRPLAPARSKGDGTLRYFFPVYECPNVEGFWTWQWNAFTGVALPKACAKDFKRLCRVTNAQTLPFWLSICIPSDKTGFLAHQRLARGWFRLAPVDLDYPRPAPGLWDCASALRAREHQGDPEAAVRVYRDALATDPRNRVFQMGLGRTLEAQGDWRAAADVYRAAIHAAPAFSAAYEKLDALLVGHGGTGNRIAEWRAITQSLPDVFLPRFCLARALEAAGDMNGAITCYREAGERDPYAPAISIALAGAFSKLGRWTEARASYQEAEKLCPNDANIKAGIGQALLRTNDAAGAIPAYRAAIGLCPKEAAFHVGLGDALLQSGDVEAARKAYLDALAVYPDYPLAYQGLNAVFQAGGGPDAALAAWRKTVRDHPQDSRAYTYLAMALVEHGDIDAAIEVYQRALGLNPDDPAIHSELEQLLLRKGESAAAAEHGG